MDRDDTTKVADFGLSRETVEDVYEVRKVGNQLHMCTFTEGQTCNMYSYTCIVYCMYMYVYTIQYSQILDFNLR